MEYSAFVLLGILTLAIFNLIPSVIADTEWKIYKLSHEGQVFKIPYMITNGDVKEIKGDIDFPAITVFVQSDTMWDGRIEITIPRELINPVQPNLLKENEIEDDVFIVLVDGDTADFAEIRNTPCSRTLSIPIPAGSKAMEILTVYLPETPKHPSPPLIHIVTDKNHYEVGDVIEISGCISLALDDKELILEIINPEGKTFRTLSVIPYIDGSFSASLVVEGPLAVNGTYIAKAAYAGQSATNSFVVPEFPVFGLFIFAVAISAIFVIRLMPKLSRGKT